MTDGLMAKLRAAKPHCNHHANAGLCKDAADRIQSLTAALNEAFDFLGGVDGASEIRGRILNALSQTGGE